jgi:hypothetical protein
MAYDPLKYTGSSKESLFSSFRKIDSMFLELYNTADEIGLSAIQQDTTPALGGNLDLNSFSIAGTGNINIDGNITSTKFLGELEGTVTGSVTDISNHILDELGDVSIPTIPTNGEVLAWNSSNARWEAASVAAVTPGTQTLDDVLFQGAITLRAMAVGGLQVNGVDVSGLYEDIVGTPAPLEGQFGGVTYNDTTGVIAIGSTGGVTIEGAAESTVRIGIGTSGNIELGHGGINQTILVNSPTAGIDYNDIDNAPASILDFNIIDGTPGQVLVTDGFGGFSFADQSGGGGAQVGLDTRTVQTVLSGTIANNGTSLRTATGYKSYALMSIETDAACWVTVYTSVAARTADLSRTITTDPTPGSGVIAEAITSSAQIQKFTPAVFGYNDESTPVDEIYLKIVNLSGASANITVNLKLLKLEA